MAAFDFQRAAIQPHNAFGPAQDRLLLHPVLTIAVIQHGDLDAAALAHAADHDLAAGCLADGIFQQAVERPAKSNRLGPDSQIRLNGNLHPDLAMPRQIFHLPDGSQHLRFGVQQSRPGRRGLLLFGPSPLTQKPPLAPPLLLAKQRPDGPKRQEYGGDADRKQWQNIKRNWQIQNNHPS